MQMEKPEGYPDLIKVMFLGDEFLIDYKEGNIRPLGITDHHPARVIKYMVDEGFVIFEEEESEEPKNNDFSRN